jgi:hypothetical protein
MRTLLPIASDASIAPAVSYTAMNRRAFVTGLGALLAAPRVVEAQQAGKVWRIGYLTPFSLRNAPPAVNAFNEGLRDLGYIEGRNVVIERRTAFRYGESNRCFSLLGDKNSP